MNYIIDKYKKEIDNKIDKIIDNELDNNSNLSIKLALNELKRLSRGGKRIRGILIKIGQLLNDIDNDSYLDLAAAFEIFQTSVLIHDDIIDEAEERRGFPTITKVYPDHNGISKAICIGDLGFFLSYKLINEMDFDSETKVKLLKCYTDTLYNTVIGEIIDVELPLKNFKYHLSMDEKEIYEIYINKTSWYTFIGPLLLGCISTGMEEEKLNTVINIGLNLGIAFQIKDDLLGLYSSSKELGKTLNDISENKQTIIYKYAIDNANKEEKDIINKLYGKDINANETNIILDLFEKLGAKANAERLVKEYTDKAIQIINNSDFQNRDILIELASKLVARNR